MKRKRDDNQLVLSFFDFDDEKENNWEEHWDGMPDWDHDKKDTPYKIIIRCKNQTDWISLGDLLSIPLCDIPRATISTWYPKKNKRDLKSYRIILEGDTR